MKRIPLVILALAAMTPVAQAQNNLSQEITVDRTIVPVERVATRLSTATPQLLQYNARNVTLTPVEYSRSASLTTSLAFLEPAPWRDTLDVAPWRGYAGIGYMPVYNLWATAGARLIDKPNTAVQAWLQYDGASYKAELAPNYKPAFAWHQGNLGASLQQRVGKESQLDVDFGMMFDGRRMPFNHLSAEKESATAFNTNLKAGWTSRFKSLDYHAKVGADIFSFGKDMNYAVLDIDPTSSAYPPAMRKYYFSSTPARDTNLGFELGASYRIDNSSRLALDIEGQYVFTNDIDFSYHYAMSEIEEVPEKPLPATGFSRALPAITQTMPFYNYGITTLRPRYGFTHGNLSGELGLKLSVLSAGKKSVKVCPDVHLHYVPSSVFGVNLDIDGGLEAMTLRRVFGISPYVFRSIHYNPENTPLRMHLAVNFGPVSHGLSGSVYGDVNVVRGYLSPSVLLEENSRVNDFLPCSLSGWHVGVKANYAYRGYGSAYVLAEAAAQGDEKGYAPWRDRAKYVIGAGVKVTMVENLDLAADYELRAKRRCFVVGGVLNDSETLSFTPMNLRNMSNLSLTAAYNLSKQLTVFLRGENLLNRAYYDVFLLPEQRIHGLLGATYKF